MAFKALHDPAQQLCPSPASWLAPQSCPGGLGTGPLLVRFLGLSFHPCRASYVVLLFVGCRMCSLHGTLDQIKRQAWAARQAWEELGVSQMWDPCYAPSQCLGASAVTHLPLCVSLLASSQSHRKKGQGYTTRGSMNFSHGSK